MRGLSYMRLQQVGIHDIRILTSFCGHYHDTVAIAVISRKFNWCSTTVHRSGMGGLLNIQYSGESPVTELYVGHECCSVLINALIGRVQKQGEVYA
jgi:hypothetical protein